MLDLYVELRGIAAALDTAHIGYALAGGLAVSIYAAPRATDDIDLVVAAQDVARIAETLAPLGFRRAGRAMPVAGGRIEIHRLLKFEGADLLPLDLLVLVDAELARRLDDRIERTLEGQRLWIIGLDSLRALKRLRGSTLDRADLEALGEGPDVR